MKTISLLIPCYNEEKSLPLLYPELCKVSEQLREYQFEYLFVNDGSKDKTIAILQELRQTDLRVNYVDLSRNFGKESAMLAGFDFINGDCVVIMDADLQHPPHLILEMVHFWEQGFEDVYAKRIVRGKESWLRKQFSLSFYKLLNKVSRIEMPQNVGDFRLLDKRCINVLKTIRERERYTKGLFAWIGFNKKEILFEQQDRAAGESSWNFWSLFNLAIEGITSFTVLPLRLSTIFGLIVSGFAFLYMLFTFIKTLLFGDTVQGFPTLLIIVLFLGGIQLVTIGIIGEYLGRVFNETKQRPVYIAREYNGELLN